MMERQHRALYSVEAEQALLGAFLVSNGGLIHVAGELSPDHFYEPAHAKLYSLMLEEMSAGRSFTAVTMAIKLGDIGLHVTTSQYLASIAGAAMSVIRPQEYADAIIELAAQRRLKEICQATIADLESADCSSGDLTARLLSDSEGVTCVSDAAVFKTEREIGIQIIENAKVPVVCTATGFPRLDEAMDGGLHPGSAYGFMGRFKSGKTLFSGTISNSLTCRENPVKHVYFALEMGAKAIHQRKLAARTNTFPSHFRDPRYRDSPGHLRQITESVHSTPDACIYADVPGVSFERLQRLCATAVYRHRINGFILDYWQLVTGQRKSQSRADHLEEVAQWVAEFTKKHGVWAIVLGQINQTGNTRGSEGSQLAFDQVFDICRPDDDAPVAWLESRASRHSAAIDIGSSDAPAYEIDGKGPYFRELIGSM